MTTSPNSRETDRRDLWGELLAGVAGQWPVDRWRDLGVVVGCSGGADSVALVSALASLRSQATASPPSQAAASLPSQAAASLPSQAADRGIDPPRGFLVVAHFNHQLRGAESDADQALAWQLSQQLGLRWAVDRAKTLQRDEASMREERIRFLVETAHAVGARYIALAHSADDNVETLLHHLMRGTGPSGLAGIGSPRAIAEDLVLVRPLLQTRRELIRASLAERGIPWREDTSNGDLAYRRNWIRHQLIPFMEMQYPQASEAIGRAIDGQRQWRSLIDRQASSWLEEHQIDGNPRSLRRDSELDPAIAVAAAQLIWTRLNWPRGEMSQTHWLRLAETLRGNDPQRYTLPAGVDVSVVGDLVELRGAFDEEGQP